MKTVEYKTKRLIAQTPEERSAVKSWGSWWSRFGVLERSGKPIYLIFGDWSGYRSSQYQITHVDYASIYGNVGQKIDDTFRGTVQFTDNTTMTVWVQCLSREQILMRKLHRRENYTDLIGKLIRSGKTYYKIGEEIKTL